MSERVDTTAIQREGNDHLNKDTAPRSDQPYAEMFALQRDQINAAEPDEPEPWAVMTPIAPGSYRFVTSPGIGGTAIRLQIPVETDDRDESVLRKNKYKQWLERQVKQGRIDKSEVVNAKDFYGLKADKAVFDIIGEYSINFTPLRDRGGRRRKQAEYVTNEKVVAAYIRGRLNRGDFPEITEDIRPVVVEIDGVPTEMMPVTEAGKRRVAMAAAAAG